MAEQAHASQLVHHDNQMLFNEVSRLSAQLQAAQHRVQEADARYAMQQQAAQQHAARKAADDAADASEPPTFPHLFPGVISDHLILTCLTKDWPRDGGERGEASLRACTRPHLGVSLSLSDLSYKPAVPGEVQELEL